MDWGKGILFLIVAVSLALKIPRSIKHTKMLLQRRFGRPDVRKPIHTRITIVVAILTAVLVTASHAALYVVEGTQSVLSA
jgi:hypothetical protein